MKNLKLKNPNLALAEVEQFLSNDESNCNIKSNISRLLPDNSFKSFKNSFEAFSNPVSTRNKNFYYNVINRNRSKRNQKIKLAK